MAKAISDLETCYPCAGLLVLAGTQVRRAVAAAILSSPEQYISHDCSPLLTNGSDRSLQQVTIAMGQVLPSLQSSGNAWTIRIAKRALPTDFQPVERQLPKIRKGEMRDP